MSLLTTGDHAMNDDEVVELMSQLTVGVRNDLCSAFEMPDAIGLAVVAPQGDDRWRVSLLGQAGTTQHQLSDFLDTILPKVVRLIAHEDAVYDDGTSWQWEKHQGLWFSLVTSVEWVAPDYVPDFLYEL
jgi:hypothetical protein